MAKKIAAVPSDVDRIVNAIESLTAELKAIGERLAPRPKPRTSPRKRKPSRKVDIGP